MEIPQTMKTRYLVLAVAAVGGLAWYSSWALKSGDGEKQSPNVIVGHDRRADGGVDAKSRKHAKRITKIRDEKSTMSKEKPVFDFDDEANLNEEQRALIAKIREALDDEDKKTVLRLVQKMQKSDEWPDGIPKAVKMAAIEAMGWFGLGCLPEIVGFLADGDQEVVQSTLEKLEEAISDMDLSDRDRSSILMQVAKVVNDSDTMDSILFELNNMRHSVAVATIKELMVSGSDATKSVLPDNVEFYTGEEGLDTPEKLDKWLEENPDDEDDEDYYGGAKD